MLRWRALAWAAAGLALALLAAVALLPARPRVAPATLAGAAADTSEASPPAPAAVAPASGADRRPAAEPAAVAAPALEPALDQEPARARLASDPGHGRVAGLVSRPDGAPLGGALLALVDGPEGFGQRRARSDALGTFAFERVPAGAWTLEHHTQGPPVHDTMVGFATALEVLAGGETWAPVQLEGERRLSGRLTMDLEGFGVEGRTGFVLLLELRPRWSTGAPLARARVHALETPPWEQPDLTRDKVVEALADVGDFRLRNQVDPDDPATWPPREAPEWVAGAFRFDHLPADLYVLRIALEDNATVTTTIDGERLELDLWLEREVDLTAGDLELPAEELDLHEDFLRAAYQRHLEHSARNPPAPPTRSDEDP